MLLFQRSQFPECLLYRGSETRKCPQAPALGWEAIGGNNSQEPKKNNPVKKGVNGAKEAFVALAAMITIFNFGWFWPAKIDKKPAGQPAKSFQTFFCSPNKT